MNNELLSCFLSNPSEARATRLTRSGAGLACDSTASGSMRVSHRGPSTQCRDLGAMTWGPPGPEALVTSTPAPRKAQRQTTLLHLLPQSRRSIFHISPSCSTHAYRTSAVRSCGMRLCRLRLPRFVYGQEQPWDCLTASSLFSARVWRCHVQNNTHGPHAEHATIARLRNGLPDHSFRRSRHQVILYSQEAEAPHGKRCNLS